MTLDDCDLPEVRALYEYNGDVMFLELPAAIDTALTALYEKWQFAESWPGLLTFLDRAYPESVFDGSSGDPGPQIVLLTRALGRAQAELEQLKRGMVWCEKCEWYTHCKLGCAIEYGDPGHSREAHRDT